MMMNTEPDYEAALGLIKHLSSDELNDLINDENKLLEVIKDLPQMKNIQSEKEMLLAANKSLADYNLSFEPQLLHGRQELISKYEECQNAQDQLNLLAEQLNKPTKKTPEELQVLIKEAVQESEEETEKLIQSFLDKIPTVESFLEEFVPKKRVAHLRKIKMDKMVELIAKHRNEDQNSLFQPPVITNPWSTPYPPRLPNMPMPPYSMQ